MSPRDHPRQTDEAQPMKDPTYVKAEIDADPVWALAFRLSEVDNDNAPIGWSRYIVIARWLLDTFHMTDRRDKESGR